MDKPTFLVSRTDRAGDLILTMPVFRELRRNFPQSTIIAHVRQYTAPLLSLCPDINRVIIDDAYPAGLFCNDLASEFTACQIDQAIIVHPSSRAILAAWRAKIARRTGRASNIWQLLLNDRRVQKRSRNEKHEFEYNLDLLSGICKDLDYSPMSLSIPEALQKTARDKLLTLGIKNQKPVVIHPGHGGSAHNISPQQYARLARYLTDNNIPVIISLGPGEEDLQSIFPTAEKGKCTYLSGVPDLANLAGIFSLCSAFAGGSTGPLHLAAALKLPCAAFFPPVKAMTPKRWGPVGCKRLVIKPDLGYCNGKCLQCSDSGCMNRLAIEPAAAWLIEEFNNEHTNNNK